MVHCSCSAVNQESQSVLKQVVDMWMTTDGTGLASQKSAAHSLHLHVCIYTTPSLLSVGISSRKAMCIFTSTTANKDGSGTPSHMWHASTSARSCARVKLPHDGKNDDGGANNFLWTHNCHLSVKNRTWVMYIGGQSSGIPSDRSLYTTVFIPVLCSLHGAGIIRHSVLVVIGVAVGDTESRHFDMCVAIDALEWCHRIYNKMYNICTCTSVHDVLQK